ncbi:hypothetical protein BVX95_00855 [archaeon D22]|nr:hypothetical protein BVX95_00855 [archaeon D22]
MIHLKNEYSVGNSSKFMSEYVSEKIKHNLDILPFKNFFGENVDLVPVPKSSLMKKGSLWVPEKIAKALSNQGLGNFYPCLERVQSVSKSSYSKSSERPKAIDHFNTIKFVPQIHQPNEIILVDDVITRGSTIMGCANVLRKQFPNISIKGFAVLRTISNPDDFNVIGESCVGNITLRTNGETQRTP